MYVYVACAMCDVDMWICGCVGTLCLPTLHFRTWLSGLFSCFLLLVGHWSLLDLGGHNKDIRQQGHRLWGSMYSHMAVSCLDPLGKGEAIYMSLIKPYKP